MCDFFDEKERMKRKHITNLEEIVIKAITYINNHIIVPIKPRPKTISSFIKGSQSSPFYMSLFVKHKDVCGVNKNIELKAVEKAILNLINKGYLIKNGNDLDINKANEDLKSMFEYENHSEISVESDLTSLVVDYKPQKNPNTDIAHLEEKIISPNLSKTIGLNFCDLYDKNDEIIANLKQKLNGNPIIHDEIFSYYAFNVRLKNTLIRNNVRTFIDILELTAQELYRMDGMGRKSFKELMENLENIDIISIFGNNKTISENLLKNFPDDYFDIYLSALNDYYSNQIFFNEEIATHSDLSVRLKNALIANRIYTLNDISRVNSNYLLKLRGLGRESFDELRTYLYKNYPVDLTIKHAGNKCEFKPIYVIDYETISSIDDSNGRYLLSFFIKESERKYIEKYDIVYVYDLKSFAPNHPFFEDKEIIYNYGFYQSIILLKNSIVHMIHTDFKLLLDPISKTQYNIITARVMGKTLENIGNTQELTRERIRQIINNVISKLSRNQKFISIKSRIRIITNNCGYITKDALEVLFKQLTPIFIMLCNGSYNQDLCAYFYDESVMTKVWEVIKSLPEVIEVGDLSQITNENSYSSLVEAYIGNNYVRRKLYLFKKKPNLLELYSIVLEKSFHTIKIYEQSEIAAFRKSYVELFGDESIMKTSDRAISGTFERIENLVMVNRGEYHLNQSEVPDEMIKKLEKTIINKLSIPFNGLFEIHCDELKFFGVKNAYQLHSIINKQLPGYYTNRDFVSVENGILFTQQELIDNFVETQKSKFTLKDMKTRIPGLSEQALFTYMETGNKLINIYNKQFVPTSLLKLSTHDKEKIYKILRDLTESGNIVTSQRILVEILGHEFVHVLKDNQIDNAHYAINFLKFYFKDYFNFQNNCISDFSVEIKIPNNRMIDEFKTKTKFNIKELIDYAKANWIVIGNMKTLLESFYDLEFIRIDDENIVQSKMLKFPDWLISQIEELIIENMIKGSIFTEEIQTYSEFPKITIPWNEHLLAHLIKNFGSRLYVIESGDTYMHLSYELKERENE